MKATHIPILAVSLAMLTHAATAAVDDGSVLPFPPTPSASVAGPTLQESKMTWRKEPERLKPGAPNVLIVLIDDVGFGQSDTFGGEIHTPTMTRLRDSGIAYNAFHTTSICSSYPCRPADRPQPSPRRQLVPSPSGLWTLTATPASFRRPPPPLRRSAPLRLQIGRLRQVAQHPGQPDHRDGTVRSLADRPRV